MSNGADLSVDGRYRYRLWRSWGQGSRCVFIMLNPSAANASEDDPTIRKCIGFAKRWQYDGLEVVNLFAWRATDPQQLYHLHEPIGELNNDVLRTVVGGAGRVICAWGNHGGLHKRSNEVLDLLRPYGQLMALHVTKQDQPGHPLYLPYETAPFTWDDRPAVWGRFSK